MGVDCVPNIAADPLRTTVTISCQKSETFASEMLVILIAAVH